MLSEICSQVLRFDSSPHAAPISFKSANSSGMIIADSDRNDSTMVCKRTVNSADFLILILIVQKQAPVIEESSPQEGPPSYDYATENRPSGEEVRFTSLSCLHCLLASQDAGKQKPDSTPVQPLLIPHPLPEPSYIIQPSYTTQPLSTPSPMVYNYINPVSGERVVSLLPPKHPEMICLQSGSHVPHTRFGLLGEH